MRFAACAALALAFIACSSTTTQHNVPTDAGSGTGGTSGAASGGGAGSGGVGGTAGASGGAAGASGTAGISGSGGSSGSEADAGSDAGSTPIGVEGQPCGNVGDLACAGHAQKLQLRCDATRKWAVVGVCDDGENCDTGAATLGSCQPIVAGCAGKNPGDVVCDGGGKKRISCGADLVTSLDVQACSIYGSCEADQCKCGSGFTGDGVTCTDVNECATSNGGCAAEATCANSVGARTCTCKPGYQGSGLVCGDVNECLTNNGGCSAQATCSNTVGSRTCTCKNGYDGDGVTCADVDECLTNNGGCASPGGKCTNTPGSRSCACIDGYEGNGTTCTRCGNGRYIVSGDGLYVTDSSNGKTWKRAIEPGTYTYDQAIARCVAIGLRLPTQAELSSLLEAAPANHINNCAFPGSPGSDFWTSTAYTDPQLAYYVRFGSNVVSYSYKTDLNRARCLY